MLGSTDENSSFQILFELKKKLKKKTIVIILKAFLLSHRLWEYN